MEQPAQNPPVERLYMRLIVGRKGKPDSLDEDATPAKKRGKTETRPRAGRTGDFLLELTTFHVRPRRRAGP